MRNNRQRSTLFCLLAVGVIGSFHFATHAAAESKQANDDWLQHYYLHPAPEKFTEEIRKLQAAGALSNENLHYNLAAFFARLFSTNGDKLTEWMKVVDGFPHKDQQLFAVALRWADSPKTDALLEKYANGAGRDADFFKSIRASTPPDFKALRYPDPKELDGCWGSFFATGDKDYVLTVLWCAATTEKKDAFDMSREAARWSLKALCQAHPAVVKIKDSYYETASDAEKKSLDELFANAKKTEQPRSSTGSLGSSH